MDNPSYLFELDGFTDLTPQVRAFHLRCVEPPFRFEPGQHVFIGVPVAGELRMSAYSIASPPVDGQTLDLCVRRVEGAAGARFLYGLSPGARVTLRGPSGRFRLRPPPARACLFVATGTGVAPIRSMLLSLLPGSKGIDLTLLFGVRSLGDLLYREEFEKQAGLHPRFAFLPVLSRPDGSWDGLRGYVQDHLEETLSRRTTEDVYVCGWKAMVDEVRRILQRRGFPEGAVHTE